MGTLLWTVGIWAYITVVGWNVFNVGICADERESNHWYDATWQTKRSFTLSVNGQYTGTPDLYIGCLTCADPTVEYIIHSVWINHSTSCANDPLSNAFTNSKYQQLICIDWPSYTCPNGLLEDGPEDWDDNNAIDGDGCSSTWKVETLYSCTDISNTLSVCTDICGDGKVAAPTAGYWDDGGVVSGDGWDANCAVEANWEWTLGNSTTASACTDIWGDGKVMSPTPGYCDDGNTNSEDGWSATCAVETGYVWTMGDSTAASLCTKWNDTYCLVYKNKNTWSCETWNDESTLQTDGTCKYTPLVISVTAKKMSTASQATSGGTVVVTFAASLLTSSSLTTIWVTANQMQLFMLLILTKSALPYDIIAFITSNSFMSFSMDFLPLTKRSKFYQFFRLLSSFLS